MDESQSKVEHSTAVPSNSIDNPQISKRKALVKLKQSARCAQILKNRLKVLVFQEQSNQRKIKIQNNQLEKHFQAHEFMLKNRNYVTQRIKSFDKMVQLRQNSQKIKIQSQIKVNEALKRLKQEKELRGRMIKNLSQNSQSVIKRKKQEHFEHNKQQKRSVAIMKQRIKKTLEEFVKQKVSDCKERNQKDKKQLLKKSFKHEKLIEEMARKQRELMEKNSESLNASRLVRQKFEGLYLKKRTNKLLLPEISRKSIEESTSTQVIIDS